MNTSIKKFYDIDNVDLGDKTAPESKPVSETDMKIFRAANYQEEKVKAIRELMEEDNLRFLKWLVIRPVGDFTDKEIVAQYIKSKTK